MTKRKMNYSIFSMNVSNLLKDIWRRNKNKHRYIMKIKMNISENKNKWDVYSSTKNDINSILNKYIHGINSRTFYIDTLKTINNLGPEYRLEILIIYNRMISYYLSLFEE